MTSESGFLLFERALTQTIRRRIIAALIIRGVSKRSVITIPDVTRLNPTDTINLLYSKKYSMAWAWGFALGVSGFGP